MAMPGAAWACTEPACAIASPPPACAIADPVLTMTVPVLAIAGAAATSIIARTTASAINFLIVSSL